ncbi:MAG: hypothetical protein LBN71_00410 [Tannerella sp.]|nr:hypothetical protein [Tannerella sp.]
MPVDAVKEFLVPFSEIELSQEDIIKEIGYKDTLPDDSIPGTIDRLLALLKKTVQPRYVFQIHEGEIEGASVHILNETFLTGPTITHLLEKSSSFALFAATAGVEFEQILQECKRTEDDILVNYLLDIMGTCIVEKTGDYMERKLEEEIGAELLHTHRFSPGYCNWRLTEQRKIFSLLGNRPCGITLSDVCLMLPVKSISGIIGIGKEVKRKQYACQYCELETCYKRKKATA